MLSIYYGRLNSEITSINDIVLVNEGETLNIPYNQSDHELSPHPLGCYGENIDDYDSDGLCDGYDEDDDNDGVLDNFDQCSVDENSIIGDGSFEDYDGDGCEDTEDFCPNDVENDDTD